MQAGVRVNRKKRGLKPTDPERTLERKEPS
jgi:hypothetical protein